jgi:multiple sugar transport system permease protein
VIGLRRSRSPEREESSPAGLLSHNDWGRRDVKWSVGSAQAVLFVLVVLIGLGPVLWLAKGAVTPTLDTLRNPLAFFPHGVAWGNLSDAWSKVDVGRYFWNTIVLAVGSWLCQIIVATTGAFALSVLRPAWGRFVYALLLGTLFVPGSSWSFRSTSRSSIHRSSTTRSRRAIGRSGYPQARPLSTSSS